VTRYTILNIIYFLASSTTAWLLLRDRLQILRSVRVSMLITILAFPWDHLAISYHAWDYGSPGLRLFDVPLNDSAFIFCCSLFTTTILLSLGIARQGTDRTSTSDRRGDLIGRPVVVVEHGPGKRHRLVDRIRIYAGRFS
jgi:lycopene cyclase domain-containing protein